MQTNRATLGSALDRGASIILEVAVVIILAMLIPVILVGAVALAIYGDVTKKRNRWTGLDAVAQSREVGLAEAYGVEIAPRSGLGRRAFVKRWIGLLGVGLLVSAMGIVIVNGLPSVLVLPVLVLLALSYAVPALIFSVKWSTARAEDAGRNGAWGFLMLVPAVNVVALLVFSALPSRSQ